MENSNGCFVVEADEAEPCEGRQRIPGADVVGATSIGQSGTNSVFAGGIVHALFYFTVSRLFVFWSIITPRAFN